MSISILHDITVSVEWYPIAPIVTTTNFTLNIPMINYTEEITATPNMPLSYSFVARPNTVVEASMFASNEYGDGTIAYSAFTTGGIYFGKNNGT